MISEEEFIVEINVTSGVFTTIKLSIPEVIRSLFSENKYEFEESLETTSPIAALFLESFLLFSWRDFHEPKSAHEFSRIHASIFFIFSNKA